MKERHIGIGTALGTAFAFLFDPQSGKRRRRMLRDRTRGAFRRGARRAERAGRGARATVYGAAQQVRHRKEEPKDFDDVTLARKVQTEIFRPAHVPKGTIVVNVQNGIVQLRGEVPSPDLIDELVRRAHAVQGVRGVEDLLHVPGTPAPMHQ